MRRVLMVSPHFPPVNAADHQRVRMALPYMKDFGWEASVLAVDGRDLEGVPIDPLLSETVPDGVTLTRARALPLRATRLVGLGSLAMRALPALWRRGNQLLDESYREERRFDLVFFSTTQFPVMLLGPVWKRRFGVPYAVDFQDPWLDDYYERSGKPPPGGALRYRLSRLLARQLEPRVMQDVSEVISVSPAYVDTLRNRYPHLPQEQLTVLPFGAPEKDFEMLQKLDVKQSLFDPADGKQHWVYVGAVGQIMQTAIRLLFAGIAGLRKERTSEWRDIHLHFAGTSYAPSHRAVKTVEPIAQQCGVEDLVTETTNRLPYFETLKALTEADALLVVGSDSPSYTASKLYPYILARKPMLSVLHEQSPAVEILRKCRAGEMVTFDPVNIDASRDSMRGALQKLHSQLSAFDSQRSRSDVNWEEFEQYTAREMTRKICAVFDRAVEKDTGV